MLCRRSKTKEQRSCKVAQGAEVVQQLRQGVCFGQALHPICDWVEDLGREPLIAMLEVEPVSCLGLEVTIDWWRCLQRFLLFAKKRNCAYLVLVLTWIKRVSPRLSRVTLKCLKCASL